MDEILKREIESKLSIKTICDALGLKVTSDYGGQIRCTCPIHKGDNKSGFLIKYKNVKYITWRCYSGDCGFGDLIELFRRVNDCRFTDAVEMVCRLAGVDYSDSTTIYRPITPMFYDADVRAFNESMEKMRDKSLDVPAEPRYVSPFLNEDFVKQCIGMRNQYFVRRGFTTETLDKFEVGFCPVHKSPWNKTQHPARVTIPLRNLEGRLVGVSGRVIKSGDIADKYNILPGSRRGEILYGLNFSMPFIKEKDEVIIVEGFADLWRCWQNGRKNVVALMSKETSFPQEKLLFGIANRYIVAVDNDKHGRKGGDKVVKRLREIGTVSRAYSPEGKDVGELSVEELDFMMGKAQKRN